MTFGGTVGPSTEKPGQEADSGVMVSEVSERSTHTHTPPSVKYNTTRQQDTAGRTGAQRAAGMAWRRGVGGPRGRADRYSQSRSRWCTAGLDSTL